MSSQSRLVDQRAIVRQLWTIKVHEPKKIAAITHILLSTVYRYVTKLKKTGTLSPHGHSGRPKIISIKQCHQLDQIVKHQANVTSAELAARLNKTSHGLKILIIRLGTSSY
ncbi:10367_t:CDS:2 [Acaulospora morrowiae]|uniref:10367_t:CDS:1 n=1 Tax=Acaulospora morrowiae TaxID=94023 RepID=A0A9N8VDF0_9GLOM|nr:10367_t:CDS:2 [Acaulospora morrowiae]